MNRIYFITLIFLIMITFQSFGQQDAQYTQYMYNTMSINPAYAGSRDVISIAGIYRNQWVGIEGAPVTQTFTVHTPVGASNKVGLGFSLINDKIGPTQETYFDIDFSYTINTSEDAQLAFGVKGGGHLLDVNFKRLNEYTTSDLLLDTNIDNKFSPNVGFGIYFHKENFYLGASVPNVLETRHFDESSNDNRASSYVAEERLNYYVIGGYVFQMNQSLKLKPSVLLKAVQGSPIQLDLSANLLLYEKLTFGLAYRLDAALSAQIGFNISDKMMIGFAYDWETTALGNTEFNSGSYEFFLRYEFFKTNRVLSPRFF
ncbi:PorP/SprF family type IX secretion system membrane protein [Aquimarina pacifica]|uniref:PorP/SprF family type IX secretion system membrane protein n=1 Tax=Aquimarina pacifica TaxID=1296415 RepID=UPI0004717217|nr:type IX secretion system membrane protein PorP/SprF [Aquimarina pacifica]